MLHIWDRIYTTGSRQTEFRDFSPFVNTVCLLGPAAVPCVSSLPPHTEAPRHVTAPLLLMELMLKCWSTPFLLLRLVFELCFLPLSTGGTHEICEQYVSVFQSSFKYKSNAQERQTESIFWKGRWTTTTIPIWFWHLEMEDTSYVERASVI